MSWKRRDDAELLNAAVRDRAAFAAFYDLHAVAVYRWFACRTGREGTVAAELTAETFAEALRSLPRLRGTRAGSGTAWLFGIARNLAREHHRSRRVRDYARRELGMPRLVEPDVALDEAEDRADAVTLRGELERALAQLSPAQREAVELRVIDGRGYPEIARVTDTTEQTVRLRVSRGLRALRDQLAPVPSQEGR